MSNHLPDASLFLQAERHLNTAALHSHTAFFVSVYGGADHPSNRDYHKQMALLSLKRAAEILGLELVERHPSRGGT